MARDLPEGEDDILPQFVGHARQSAFPFETVADLGASLLAGLLIAEFAARLPAHGVLFYNADDPRCRAVAAKAACNTISFGEAADATWRLANIDASSGFAMADITCRGMPVGRMNLQVPGRVNALNALGALAAANWAGIPVYRALKSLQSFGGVKRRFEVIGSVGGVPLVDPGGLLNHSG